MYYVGHFSRFLPLNQRWRRGGGVRMHEQRGTMRDRLALFKKSPTFAINHDGIEQGELK